MRELVQAHLDHKRSWYDFHYCYPVISRRSKCVSLGVNLNPNKVCNFDCVYCEVDRVNPPRRKDVDLDQLEQEMAVLMDLVVSGELYQVPPFGSARVEQRRLNDIAFSGDGEPTMAMEFAECVARLAKLKEAKGLHDCKLVLISDATLLQAPGVIKGLEILMANQGEVWAKLDGGTEAHYREINRSRVPFQKILDNLVATAKRWPITIQTLFLEWQGEGPSAAEVDAYIDRLRRILAGGGRLEGIQLYTVARATPEPEARPLKAALLDAVAVKVQQALPTIPVEVFYGPGNPGHE
jgi:wyosine [tRNA(Phe)-imidazoG37] synthetase (radical SAM superfamily)